MAKGFYVGVDSKARKVTKAYVGVSGEVTVQGDIIPKTWTNTTHDTYVQEYTAEDGTKIFSYGGVTTNAFDGNTGSYWQGMTTGAGYNYIGIIFTEPKKITKLKTHVKETYGAIFQIQGSNNGSEWTPLQGGAASQTALAEIVLENTDYYSQYRIYFPNKVGDLPRVYEIQVSEYVVPKSDIARKIKKGYIGVAEDSLVANGDFSNGLEGWTQETMSDGTKLYTATLESDNEGNYVKVVQKETYTTDTSFIVRSTNFPTYNNHVYYICGKVKHGVNNSANSTCRARLSASNVDTGYIANGTASNTNWHFISTIFTRTKDVAKDSLILNSYLKANTTGNEYYYRDVKEYDLTEMFGAGNEPTKEWCDENLEELKTLHKSQNGKARLFYVAATYLEFTSSPVPTTWNASDNFAATATNNYGTWKISATSASNPVSSAFDSDSTTYWKSTGTTSDSLAREVILELPTNVSIKPTKIFLTHRYCGGTSYPAKIQGYDGNEWIDLGTLTRYDFKLNQEFEISTDTYFTKFKVQTYRYNGNLSSSEIYDFKITSGTLKIEE